MSHQNSIGRKFQIHFGRAKGKMQLGRKDSDKGSGFMANLPQLKKQKHDITKLTDLWKKYLSKENEVNALMTKFDKLLINSVAADEILREKSERIVAESDRTFPKNIEARIGTNLNVLKLPLDEIIKKSKSAEKCQQDVETSRAIYEKAAKEKEEEKKAALTSAEEKFNRISDDLKKDIPKVIHDTDEGFYQFLTEYLDLKIEYFKKTLNDVEDIKRNMLLARSKYAGSSPTTQAALNDLQNVNANRNSDRVSNYKTSTSDYGIPVDTTTSSNISSGGKNVGSISDAKPTLTTMAANKSRPPPLKNPSSSKQPAKNVSESDSDTDMDASRTGSRRSDGSCEDEDDSSIALDCQKGQEDDDVTRATPPFEVISLYPYTSEEHDELEFSANVIIEVLPWPHKDDEGNICEEEPEPGWLYGKNAVTKKNGLFPANYVKMISKNVH